MAKGSGNTRTGRGVGTNSFEGREATSTQNELYSFAERIQDRLTVDAGDAVFEKIGSLSKNSIVTSIENSTDYDVMNYKKYDDGSIDIQVLNRSESAEDYDYGDDGFRSVSIGKNATLAGVILDLRRKQFRNQRDILKAER